MVDDICGCDDEGEDGAEVDFLCDGVEDGGSCALCFVYGFVVVGDDYLTPTSGEVLGVEGEPGHGRMRLG